MSKNLTTAETLGQYRRDLKAEGFNEATVNDLVNHAARELHASEGVYVSEPPKCPCLKCQERHTYSPAVTDDQVVETAKAVDRLVAVMREIRDAGKIGGDR